MGRAHAVSCIQVVTIVSVMMMVSILYRLEGVKNIVSSSEDEAHIEQSWVEAETREGFMEVDLVLSDPRTSTEHPLDWKWRRKAGKGEKKNGSVNYSSWTI